MNRTSLMLVLLLCLACLFLGVAFGAGVFGCNEDEFGADHVFFKAGECFRSIGSDGSVFLDCRRVVRPGGEQ